jgi:hypothetical protein
MSLRLAVEQQRELQQERESKAPSLRDRLIQRALQEGESAEDVAEALEVSVQSIYKIVERMDESAASRSGGSGDRHATAIAIERFTDPRGFEKLVFDLMGGIEPGSIPLGGVGDSGRDAANAGSTVIWTISLSEQWQRKVRSDFQKIASADYSAERVYAVTNRVTTRRSEEKLVAEAAELGLELTVLGQAWLVAKLSEPCHLHLRSVHLGLTRPSGKVFLSAQEYTDLLDGRPHLAGFEVEFVGRGREIRRAGGILEAAGPLLIRGAGGLGKTRLALQMAAEEGGDWRFIDAGMQFFPEATSELAVSPRLVVVIDNAHRRGDLEEVLRALEAMEIRPRIVLITRPGFDDQLNEPLGRVWLGPVDSENIVDVGPLGWKAVAKILRSPPLEIEAGAQRGELVRLAEGNPQIAVIGARVARERKSVVGLSGDELLQRYIAYLIPAAIPSDAVARSHRGALALLAALDGFGTEDNELLRKVADLLRISVTETKEGLEQLAESGLIVGERGHYRIKPDLLAEHVLFALTLSRKWKTALPYEQIFERFADHHLRPLVKALGALPAALLKDATPGRLRGVERSVERAAGERPLLSAAELVRDICCALPDLGLRAGDKLLDRLKPEADEESSRVIGSLADGAMRISDFTKSWRFLLRLGAESVGSAEALKKVGDAMAETYQRLPEDDATSGAILALVQEGLAEETKKFWTLGRLGAATAVALALRPMLMLTFESHRQDPDDPMTFQLGTRTLPDSQYTEKVVKTGGTLAAEVFDRLDATGQLELLKTVDRAGRAAAGYPPSMGVRAPLQSRMVLDRALMEFDAVIGAGLSKWAMPVAAEAYEYLRERERWRYRLQEEVVDDQPEIEGLSEFQEDLDRGVEVPAAGAKLSEYLFLFHERAFGRRGRDREVSIQEEQERTLARARELASSFAAADWSKRLDLWINWWREKRDAVTDARMGTVPAMVFEAIALDSPFLGRKVIDRLIAERSELRAACAAAMGAVIAADHRGGALEDWLDADVETRITLARSLSSCPQEVSEAPTQQLASDPEKSVREAAIDSLAFSRSGERWRFDLALKALAADPEIETINQLLHAADLHAEEAGTGQKELDNEQLALLRSAVIGTACSQRLEDYYLADTLDRAARQLPRITLEWVWARLRHLEAAGEDGARRWGYDPLPADIAGSVERSATASDLAEVATYFEELPDDSAAADDTAVLIGWLGGAGDEVSELIIRLLVDNEPGRRGRALLRLPLNDEALDRRAALIAQSIEDPAAALYELIASTLPSSWSGSYVPHLEGAQRHAERWGHSSDRGLREVGREAKETYKRQIETWRSREEDGDREFEYR